MRGPVPAYSAVYLFADGPDEPPCISRVDSSPGNPRGSPSGPAGPAGPAPDTGTRRTYARRISFSTVYRRIVAYTTIREDHFSSDESAADAAEGASESAMQIERRDRRSTFYPHSRFILIPICFPIDEKLQYFFILVFLRLKLIKRLFAVKFCYTFGSEKFK